MYAADQRFRAYFDKIRPGLADYVSEALKAHAASFERPLVNGYPKAYCAFCGRLLNLSA